MAMRLAALFISGLALTTPAIADTDEFAPVPLTTYEVASAAVADHAGSALSAQFPLIDLPGPIAFLDVIVPLPPEPVVLAGFEQPAATDVEAILSSEFFIDLKDGETSLRIAHDLLVPADIVTGSIPVISATDLERADSVSPETYPAP